jgi:hypothetical protein
VSAPKWTHEETESALWASAAEPGLRLRTTEPTVAVGFGSVDHFAQMQYVSGMQYVQWRVEDEIREPAPDESAPELACLVASPGSLEYRT